jgi:malate/lactate dehydrogenase
MLSTATALIQATEDVVMDDETMAMSQFLYHNHNEMDNDQFAKFMFMLTTAIASNAVDKATKVLLTETQLRELMETIDELETMRDEVINNG